MDIHFSYPGFEGRNLFVRVGQAFSQDAIFIDGARAVKEKGRYVLRNNNGRAVEAKLKWHPFDPVPRLQIGGEFISLVEPFRWYEQVWVALPLALALLGGLIGGAIGAGAAYGNSIIFRANYHTPLKYIVTGAVTVVAVMIFFIFAVALNLLARGA